MEQLATPRSKPPLTFLVVLVMVSIYAALVTPYRDGRILYAALACYSMSAIVFQFAWLVPCTVSGSYLGLLMDPPIKGGSIESQTVESAVWMIFGAILGLVAGLIMDGTELHRPDKKEAENPEKSHDPTDVRAPLSLKS